MRRKKLFVFGSLFILILLGGAYMFSIIGMGKTKGLEPRITTVDQPIEEFSLVDVPESGEGPRAERPFPFYLPYMRCRASPMRRQKARKHREDYTAPQEARGR